MKKWKKFCKNLEWFASLTFYILEKGGEGRGDRKRDDAYSLRRDEKRCKVVSEWRAILTY